MAEAISFEPLGVTHSALHAGLHQVLDDLHLLLDVDLALGRLNDQLDAQLVGRVLRPALHVEEEGVVERLHHEGDARLVGGGGRPIPCRRSPQRPAET